MQDAVERALAEVAGHAVATICAGRTDAGVHATGQVVHFDSEVDRPESAWVRGVNAHLPDAVAVQWMLPVDAGFHARFGALERRYRYVLLDHPVRPALNRNYVGWVHQRLQLEPMRLAAAGLLGDPDVRRAFGARDMWQVVDSVARNDLGGARNSARHRALAQSGTAILDWLAEHARDLAKARAVRPVIRKRRSKLLASVAAWLAASATTDA